MESIKLKFDEETIAYWSTLRIPETTFFDLDAEEYAEVGESFVYNLRRT